MLIKTIKHDFQFSKKAFFYMAALLLGGAIVARLVAHIAMGGIINNWLGMPIMSGLLIAAIVTVIKTIEFYQKSFFDDAGYLMLTLPVTRGTLLFSKIIVSIVWFNFILLAADLALFIMAPAAQPATAVSDAMVSGFVIDIEFTNGLAYLQANIAILFLFAILFWAITLNQSAFGRWRVPIIISGGLPLLYGVATLSLNGLLIGRNTEWTYHETYRHIYDAHGRTGTHFYSRMEPITDIGLRYGSIPIGDAGQYFDILRWGLIFALAAIAFGATYYLITRRVSLK